MVMRFSARVSSLLGARTHLGQACSGAGDGEATAVWTGSAHFAVARAGWASWDDDSSSSVAPQRVSLCLQVACRVHQISVLSGGIFSRDDDTGFRGTKGSKLRRLFCRGDLIIYSRTRLCRPADPSCPPADDGLSLTESRWGHGQVRVWYEPVPFAGGVTDVG
jgi:hypothetical protein